MAASINASGLFTATAAGGPFTVTAASGGKSGTASVTVTTAPPVLTTITVSPASASVQNGGTQQFTATGYDQFDNPMSPQPTFTWSVSGGGSINTSGLFTATAAGGPFTVTAASGGKSGTASVTVTTAPPVLTTITVLPASASVQAGGTAAVQRDRLRPVQQPDEPPAIVHLVGERWRLDQPVRSVHRDRARRTVHGDRRQRRQERHRQRHGEGLLALREPDLSVDQAGFGHKLRRYDHPAVRVHGNSGVHGHRFAGQGYGLLHPGLDDRNERDVERVDLRKIAEGHVQPQDHRYERKPHALDHRFDDPQVAPEVG